MREPPSKEKPARFAKGARGALAFVGYSPLTNGERGEAPG
jgi:hypothetical protein